MKLLEIRARRALSVRELARRADVAARTIYAIEHGEVVPTLATIRKLSEVLEVEPVEVDEFKAAIDKIISEESGAALARV